MQRPMILGYVTNRSLPMVTQEDALGLTHINLAFGLIRDGLLDLSGLPDIERIRTIRAYNPNIRIVLSMGGWGAGGFSNMAMTEGWRRAFADSVERALDQHALDGVDIDWEYPCSDQAGIDADPRDKENFTRLLQALRDAAGERIVSIAAGAGAYFVRDTEMAEVSKICTYVQLMTYDMRSGFCTQAGHHTALYPSSGREEGRDAMSVVELFHRAGVPYEKLVIGAAFYSRHWRGVPDVNRGLFQPAATVGGYGPGYATLAAEYIDQNGWTRHWDDEAKAPYLFNGSEFISYDDCLSIRHKCAYVKERGLGGIMYWEHGCDPTHALLQTMVCCLAV